MGRRGLRSSALWLAIVFIVASPRLTAAQSASNVLVVANSASNTSIQIAEYYSQRRQIPQDQVLRLNLPAAEEITRAQYGALIEGPISEWLLAHSAHDRILYLVLTKGIPLRIEGTTGRDGTSASVDSELTLLYRRLTGTPTVLNGRQINSYFLAEQPLAKARPFNRQDYDLYLVTRLDGYTLSDITGLIDRGVAPATDGVFVLDGRVEQNNFPGNTWLQGAAEALKTLGWGERTKVDTGIDMLRDQDRVLGYYSWGSNDGTMFARDVRQQFVPGALAGMFLSTDGRTFQEPPDGWQVRSKPFAGSTQSLAGDLIHQGITGMSAHVAEPFFDAAVRPQILFPAYVSGFNLAESFYLSTPFLSWQAIVIGDPLCAPFRKVQVPNDTIDKGVDPVTELSQFFSDRRLANLVKLSKGSPEAVKLVMKAESRIGKKDAAGAISALESATKLDEHLIAAQLTLAQLYEGSSRTDDAMGRYRLILKYDPNHVVALNNLAYRLAQRKAPAEALPLAERAFKLSKGAAAIADTLGWIYHLLGKDEEALKYLAKAVKEAPKLADVRVHAAVVYAALGRTEDASRELQEAIKIAASLEKREDVQQLRKRLATKP